MHLFQNLWSKEIQCDVDMGVKPVIFKFLSVRMKNRGILKDRKIYVKSRVAMCYIHQISTKSELTKAAGEKGHNVTATRAVPKYGTLT